MAKYPDFIQSTGYGTGEGLCGWNCRHSFHPFFPGIDEPSYTEEELQNIDPPPVEYNGKKLTYYEQTQKQRSMETAMRKTKRDIIAAKATGDDDMFTAKSVLLRRQREEYDKFSKAAGLLTQKERTQVYGFDKSIAAKASNAAKKALTLGNGNAIMGAKALQFRNDLANGKVNTTVDTQNQPKHINGKAWKNQVKQAIQSNGKITPRSRLAKGLDPQDLINKYAGKGDYYEFRGNNKYPDEFITLPFIVGRTYNKKNGKYEATNRVQIKYDEKKGAHVFPVLNKEAVK